MTLALAISLTARLAAFTFFLQGVELLWLSRQALFRKVWSYENLVADLEIGLPLPRTLLDAFFSELGFKITVLVQILAAAALIAAPHFALVGILGVTHLLVCIRFRGTFNGGSDMMGFVVLTGTLVALASPSGYGQSLGMIYIAIHTIYSYFKAGLAKLLQPDWRTGTALPSFLRRSLFPDMRKLASWLEARRSLCLGLSAGVILFELGLITIPFFPHGTELYLLAAVFFHLIVYWTLGLNRFFWNWLAAWPAVVYAISLLR